ncbi:MAG: hypothetical protein QOI20_3249 [Acidimicrobiaceae bacterium]|jgi:superfamily II DNA or RNA helicase|nr:hypothetical protein [Acidimicrobiaceae bacterium]
MPGLMQTGSAGNALLELRPYQLAGLAAIRSEFDRGVRATLLVSATGTGKTVSFAELARIEVSYGRRVLILVQRDELLKQATRKCNNAGLAVEIEKAKSRASLDAAVVIASVQSLKGKRLERFDPDHFDLVIVDECHHAPATGYRNVLGHFATARVLGVTATPDRADGAGLGDVFGSVAYRYEIREAIHDEWLVPIVARRIVLEGVDLSTIKSRAGDLAQDELAAVMETEAALRGVVVPLLDQAGDRRTIAFCVDVAHAEQLAAMLNAYRPGCARAVSGRTDDDERERLLADFAAGRFQFLTNCALLAEGFDDAGIACVAMCAPTKSRGLYVQRGGRGLRLLGDSYAASCAAGKPDCLLLDFTATAGKHRLIGPADCLRGDLTDDERAEIDRLLGVAQWSLDDAIGKAAAAVEQRTAGLVEAAIVRFHTEHIDPFVGAAGPLGQTLVLQRAWHDQPMPRPLIAALEKEGVKTKQLPPSMTHADGERLLARLHARRRAGLALLGQARRLWIAACIDARDMPRARADKLITILRVNGWNGIVLAGQPEYDAPEARAARSARKREQKARDEAKRQRAATHRDAQHDHTTTTL